MIKFLVLLQALKMRKIFQKDKFGTANPYVLFYLTTNFNFLLTCMKLLKHQIARLSKLMIYRTATGLLYNKRWRLYATDTTHKNPCT